LVEERRSSLSLSLSFRRSVFWGFVCVCVCLESARAAIREGRARSLLQPKMWGWWWRGGAGARFGEEGKREGERARALDEPAARSDADADGGAGLPLLQKGRVAVLSLTPSA
jgi:hypothetical protein